MHNYDKTFEHLRDEGVRVDVRRANPYVYISSYERNEAKETAEGLLEAAKKDMEIYRENKYVYPLIERETNFQVTWKTKLRHSLRFFSVGCAFFSSINHLFINNFHCSIADVVHLLHP